MRYDAGVSDEDRTARKELRLTPKELRLLQRAADLGGEDVSSLLRRAGLIEAHRLVARVEGKAPAGERRRSTRGSAGRK